MASAAPDPTAQIILARVLSARRAFRSDAALAEALGVHRSRIVNYRRGEAPSAEVREALVGLDTVISLLEGFLELEAVPDWLHGVNAHLGHRRPVDVLRRGPLSEVIVAIEAERSGAWA